MAVGIGLGVKVDDAQVLRLLQRAPISTLNRLRELIEGSAIDVQREMRIQAPAGVGGGAGLRGSIRYRFTPTELKAEVKPNVPYAVPVEEGSRPHWVSVKEGSSLRKWANLKGVNPYAVQKAIAAKGTKPHPYVKPTYNKMKPIVLADVARGMAQLAREIDDGRI